MGHEYSAIATRTISLAILSYVNFNVESNYIILYICYWLFHSNNINDNASPEFIKLNLLVRDKKHDIILI